MRSPKRGLLLRLAMQDLWHDRSVSFCIISSLVAVIAPLLLMFGLRYGVVSQLQQELARDPRNLEIRMVSSGHYSAEWIAALQKKSEVGFAIGQTRSLNTQADLLKDMSHFIENAEVIPTGLGDPLLGALQLEGEDEVILSSEAARRLAVREGDTIRLRVMRQLDTRREWGERTLTVGAILVPTYFNRPALFVQQSLLLALESFRDGYRIPMLGISTGLPLTDKPPMFARARIYANSIDQVAALDLWLKQQRIETVSRLADIENIKSINRVLSLIFNVIAGTALIGCIASLIGAFLANVDRKRKHIAVLRLLGFTSPAVGLYIIFQGVILTLLAYGGGILLYLSGSALFNRTLASSQSTEQMICQITPFHSLLALILALTVAILVAIIGARRAIAIQPAESLREL
ncbi:ABC transporter permease [Aeromonas caviae]|uniref:ABC transporter permease n=1 Tax=Aeromonas hydrophila TaxID=644 RepID=UPI00185F864A|nr:FtsX-like permease family protein [Aeromonas hydrophila]BCK64782.1 ABC transporter permease [Aeromonas hydrophila]GKQ62549.1 ABC transporter permease [Aeromonas caviae]